MRTVNLIAKTEYRLAMRNIGSYIVFVLFLVISGGLYASSAFKWAAADLRGYYGILHAILVFFVPAISMGSIAKEEQSGTMELLHTMPIRLWEVVFGKILAVFYQVLSLLSFTLIYYAIIATIGVGFDHGANALGFVGVVLAALSYSAIGVFASSLHKNQVMAFVIALAISGFFYSIRFAMNMIPLSLVRYVQYFSYDYHLSSFMRGVADVRDILFFLGTSLVFAFLAEFRLQARNLKQER